MPYLSHTWCGCGLYFDLFWQWSLNQQFALTIYNRFVFWQLTCHVITPKTIHLRNLRAIFTLQQLYTSIETPQCTLHRPTMPLSSQASALSRFTHGVTSHCCSVLATPQCTLVTAHSKTESLSNPVQVYARSKVQHFSVHFNFQTTTIKWESRLVVLFLCRVVRVGSGIG